jgi:hypothetical protein
MGGNKEITNFSVELIIKALAKHSHGTQAGQICRKFRINPPSHYKLISKYSGKDTNQLP